MKHHLIKPFYSSILCTLIALSSHVSAQETVAIPPINISTQQTTQVPGYFRTQVGTMQVTALFDGNLPLPASIFKGTSLANTNNHWRSTYDYTPEGSQTPISAYLINTGSQIILVDAGTSDCFDTRAGHLTNNLTKAGYQASDINVVLLTHLHPDHACGLLDKDGGTVFKNATVYANAKEVAYWMSSEQAQQASQEHKKFFPMAQKAIAPYQKSGQLKTFEAGDKIIDGVQSVAEYGHTPGHVGYLFNSGSEKMLIWGDIIHSYSLQLKNPKITIEFDQDPAQAIKTRQHILAKTASEHILVGGAHMPFPGFGHVVTEKNAYAWVPIKYLPM